VQPEVARPARLALAAALLAASQAAAGIVLGEARARSSLGEPLDARIPFTVATGESAHASCFALVRDSADGPGTLGEGILTIERRRGEAALRVRTVSPVMEPTVVIRVRATCPGGPSSPRSGVATASPPQAASSRPPGPLPATPPVLGWGDARDAPEDRGEVAGRRVSH